MARASHHASASASKRRRGSAATFSPRSRLVNSASERLSSSGDAAVDLPPALASFGAAPADLVAAVRAGVDARLDARAALGGHERFFPVRSTRLLGQRR